MLTAKDEELIGYLRLNAREPVAARARKLGLSRTTGQTPAGAARHNRQLFS
jgi:hypothetical protein